MNAAQLCLEYTVANIHKFRVIYSNVFRSLVQQTKRCGASTVFIENSILNRKAVITHIAFKIMLNLDFHQQQFKLAFDITAILN